jgi:hypothetical protein
MILKKPTSDHERSALLMACLRKIQNTDPHTAELPESYHANLERMSATFDSTMENHIGHKERYKAANSEYRKLLDQLRMLIRHALQVVRRRAQTGDIDSNQLETFGLYRDQRQPEELRRLRTPIATAKRILEANAHATTYGVTVLIDPRPADIQILLDRIQLAGMARQTALGHLSRSQTALKKVRKEANHLISQVKIYIRLHYLGQPKLKLREAMRSYGFRYLPSPKKEEAELVPPQPEGKHAEAEMKPAEPSEPKQVAQSQAQASERGKRDVACEPEVQEVPSPEGEMLACNSTASMEGNATKDATVKADVSDRVSDLEKYRAGSSRPVNSE